MGIAALHPSYCLRPPLKNSGGTCPTFRGPRNTAPSAKRSGKARAFLPSSSASFPSELMPAATPTLAFCLTTLPRPGIALSSAPNRLLRSCVLNARRDAIERRLRHAFLQHLFQTQRRNHFLDPCYRHLQFAVDPAIGIEAQFSRGNRDQFTLLNARPHDLDIAAGSLDFADLFGDGFGEKSFSPESLASAPTSNGADSSG